MNKPEPGYWLVRLVRGGPWVPAAIMWVELPEPHLEGFVCGEAVKDIEHIWHRRGRTITRSEYEFQVADQRWAREERPDLPKADPTVPVNWMKAPLPFAKRRT